MTAAFRLFNTFKPKILSRYIISEAIGPLLVGTGFFTFIMMLDPLRRVVALIIEKEAPFVQSVEIIIYMLPFNLAISIPMAVLMSAIMAYGKFSGDNEIVAMKGGGLSSKAIYLPIALYGMLMFAFMLFFNSFILPEASYRYKALYLHMINTKPSIGISPYQFQPIPGSTRMISAEDVDGDVMYNIVIYDHGGGKKNRKKSMISAERGEWINNEANSSLIQLELQNGMIQEIENDKLGNTEQTVFDKLIINIVRNVRKGIREHARSDRELPPWGVLKKILEAEKRGVKPNPTNVLEYHNKFSIPAACFVFVLIGAPLGTFSKRSGKSIGFGMSIVVIFIYYIFMTLGKSLMKTGTISGVLASWLPNIVLAVLAAYFLIRTFLSEGK